MPTMKQIYVALELNGKPTPVGVLRFDVKQGFGYFAYLPGYDGPPLDPINLNYREPVKPGDRFRRSERVFVIDPEVSPGLMHQVFVDAMPGQWGMTVLQAEYPEIRQMKDCERLHWMGARTVGALSFFVANPEDERPVRGIEQLEAVRAKCAEFQAKLERMGLQGIKNPAVASHGGVMPKASYEDATGRHWIAKFDRPGDGQQFSLLEHAACMMAGKCGIDVPQTKTISDGLGGQMFLTERFDRSSQRRFHKASFMALVGAKDAGSGDYRDMFRVLERICDPVAWPQQRDELLRRMALNIALNVTDDHLRNHEVRLRDDGYWELSPAFDLVPVPGTSPHQCSLFGQPRATTNLTTKQGAEFWEKVATELHMDRAHVSEIVRQVNGAVLTEWPAIVTSVGLNKFNQSIALMAAEVGCDRPFAEPGEAAQVRHLDRAGTNALDVAAKAIAAAVRGVQDGSMSPEERKTLVRAVKEVNSATPRICYLLRQAGEFDVAELVQTAPLSAAAMALAEPGARASGMWRDLADAGRALEGVVARAEQRLANAHQDSAPRPRA